ncbi:hypothetical protein [Ferrimonas sp. YFM]|uniref:hypothetical protein n=1 Tax=Ferrimonas sp. YFM TaxID=3028878 RepID=UPI002573B6F3|nr:hypothetical protein [Ferrimonas sp. YFM]
MTEAIAKLMKKQTVNQPPMKRLFAAPRQEKGKNMGNFLLHKGNPGPFLGDLGHLLGSQGCHYCRLLAKKRD